MEINQEIFVEHSQADREFAYIIINQLREDGFYARGPRDIQAGLDWRKEEIKALYSL